MTMMGFVHTYKGLVIGRVFLGVAECGFFPAAVSSLVRPRDIDCTNAHQVYLLTIWYKRYEVMHRMAIFYAAASLSGAFSGLLAYGIQHMEGIGGRHGWQWVSLVTNLHPGRRSFTQIAHLLLYDRANSHQIFILEGMLPVITSFFLYFILPDSPETAKFLTKHEKEFLVNRLALETGSGHGRVTNNDKIQWRHIKAAFSEWKIYCAIVCFWANTIGTYGFTATVPSIVQDLGYSSANAQLLTIPIYLFAVICVLVVACKYFPNQNIGNANIVRFLRENSPKNAIHHGRLLSRCDRPSRHADHTSLP